VRSGDTVTITTTTTYDQLTVESGGEVVVASGVSHTLTDGPGDDLTIEGMWLNQGGSWTVVGSAKWVVNDGGMFIQNSNAAISSALSKGTLSGASNFVYRGSSSLVPSSSFSGRSYGNLTFESTLGQWSCTASGSNALSIAGNLHISNGARWNTGGFSGAIIVQGKTLIEGEWSGSGNGNLGAHTFQGEFRTSPDGRYELGTSGSGQGNIIVRGDFVNNGVFTSPANRLMAFDGTSTQTIGGTSKILFNGGLAANQNIVVGTGTMVQVGAGKSATANSDMEVYGTLSGSDVKSSLVLVGMGNRLILHDALVSVAIVTAKDGRSHSISGKGAFAGCIIIADSGASIVLDGFLTLEDGKLDPEGGEIVAATGSTIEYRGSSSIPIAPLRYWNLVLEGNPGEFLIGSTTVAGTLSLNASSLTTGAYDLVLEPQALLQETGTGSIIGKVSTTRLLKRGIKESFGNTGLEILLSLGTEDSITVSRMSGAAPPIHGGAAIAKYFDLRSRGKQLDGSLILHYTSNDLHGMAPSGLRILRSTDGGASWMDEGAAGNISEQALSYAGPISDSRWTAAAMFPPPTLTAVSPSSASQCSRVTVVLTGTGFEPGVNDVTFSGQGISVNSVSVISTVRCSVDISIGGGAERNLRDVSVTTSSGTAVLRSAFEVLSPPNPVPTITRISPAFGIRGKNTTVSIFGGGLLGDVTAVTLGDSIMVRSVRTAGGSLVVDVSLAVGASPGLRDVTVSNPGPGGGSATLRSAFLVANPIPIVTSAFPNEGMCSETKSVILEGSDFIAGVPIVNFGDGITVDSTRLLTATQLKVAITIAPTALVGSRDISVVNNGPGGGTAVLLSGFRVTLPVPKIFSVAPAIGVRGTSMRVSVSGSDFLPGVTSLRLGEDIAVDSLLVVNSTQMKGTLRIPCNSRVGPQIATIMNSGPGGGSSSLQNAFEVRNPFPFVNSFGPMTGILGQTIEVDFSGSGLIDGVCSVDFGEGISVHTVSCDSIGAHMAATITIANCVLAGAHSISVTNAGPGGGTIALANSFVVENPKPGIVEVSPAGCAKGKSAMARITGRGFLQGLTTANFGVGIIVDSIAVSSATSMGVQLHVDSNTILGARGVIVTNPPPGGGSAVLPHVFNVETLGPSIACVSPKSARSGECLSVAVDGNNFEQGTTRVSFGDDVSVDSVTIISPSRLKLSLFIPRDAAIGTRAVCIFNPPPGGGTAILANAFSVASDLVSMLDHGDKVVPSDFELLEPFPNPFNPSTRIRFVVPERSFAVLSVYNALGTIVARVLEGETGIGTHEVIWCASDLSSGVYFIRLFAESLEHGRKFISHKKVVLIK